MIDRWDEIRAVADDLRAQIVRQAQAMRPATEAELSALGRVHVRTPYPVPVHADHRRRPSAPASKPPMRALPPAPASMPPLTGMPPTVADTERLASTGEIALYTPDRAAPVGYVSASGVIRNPADMRELRCAASGHPKRVPVHLLVHPFEHVADLCTGCGKAFPDEDYLLPTSGW